MHHSQNEVGPSGFTLVELAIVLMIIGLLIGGILKGQELIQNSRVTSTLHQMKQLDAAIITFMDSYGALPGDITNPSTRLPNCSAANCNMAGNGNNIIGTLGNPGRDENNTFWLHLAAANLISGIDPNSTWTSGNYYTASYPKAPLDSSIVVVTHGSAVSVTWPEGLFGHHYYFIGSITSGTAVNIVPITIVERIDTKIDDSKPKFGIVKVANCTTTPADASYGTPDPSNLCRFWIRAGF